MAFFGTSAIPLWATGKKILRVLSLLSVLLTLKLNSINLHHISTTLIDSEIPIHRIAPRVPETAEVIILNNFRAHKKINPESYLPEQRLTKNPNCNVKSEFLKMNPGMEDLSYEDIVNMRDTTGLYKNTFSDINQLTKIKSKAIVKSKPNLKGSRAKTVKFSEKFSNTYTSEDKTYTKDSETKNLQKLPAERLRDNKDL